MVNMVSVLFLFDLVEKVNLQMLTTFSLSTVLYFCTSKVNKWKALVDLVAPFKSCLFGTVSASLSQVAEHDWSNWYVHFLVASTLHSIFHVRLKETFR